MVPTSFGTKGGRIIKGGAIATRLGPTLTPGQPVKISVSRYWFRRVA
jgi:hypothetical protein